MPYKTHEQLLEQRRQWYHRNRDKWLSKMKKYYLDNIQSRKAYLAEYRSRPENRAKATVLSREYRKTHPDKRDRGDYNYFAKLKRRFSMSREDYNRMLAEQRGRCAICKGIPKTKFHVDHNHSTGEVRGLLCGPCNTALGMIERVGVSPVNRYLRKYSNKPLSEEELPLFIKV